jgi:hypothetical protein
LLRYFLFRFPLFRIFQLQQEDLRKIAEEEERLQKGLMQNHKKYEANSTFLPRLDGPRHAAAGAGGGGASSGVPPNKAKQPVKTIAEELEQMEQDSVEFPLAPVLVQRSRSARGGTSRAASTANTTIGKNATRQAKAAGKENTFVGTGAGVIQKSQSR